MHSYWVRKEKGEGERERDRNKETEIFSLQNSEKFISLLKDSHPTEACYSHWADMNTAFLYLPKLLKDIFK